MQLRVISEYSWCIAEDVNLPNVTSWDDIDDWYVKWGCLHYKLKGSDQWQEHDINADILEAVDLKRPISSRITTVPTGDEDPETLDEIE